MTTSTTTAPTGPSLPFRGAMIDANRRALDFQKRVFDTSFDMVASMQERREEAISKWTENSERLPAEAKSLVQEWIRLFQDGRSSYRSAIDASFGLANSYLDSLTAQAEESS